MKPTELDSQNGISGERGRGLLGKMLPAGKVLRFRSASRSPYRAPALIFGPWRFMALALFALGMAFVEAACVFYLWEMLYPEGFKFPILFIESPEYASLLRVEFAREVATFVMLLGCAIAAGRTRVQRVASFLFLFGLWDIFYYAWLRVLTELTHFPVFPASLGTWDLLFLIPVPWTGPVFAPMLVALTMVLFGIMFVFAEARGSRIKPDVRFWIIEMIAILMILGSFMWNHADVAAGKTPESYAWWLLLPAEIIGITALIYLIRDCFYTEA